MQLELHDRHDDRAAAGRADADEIAEYAEFFSFGTNDLTQTTFGFSRDDAEGKFLAQVRRGQDPARQPVRRRSTRRASAS